MKKGHYALAVLLSILLCLPVWAQRIRTSLNDDWRFKREDLTGAEASAFSDKDWERVNLPHSFNTQDAFSLPRGYYQGLAWYRKNFRFTPVAGRRYFIQFEGANKVAEVWLNGKSLGTHLGGYTAFSYELTPYLTAGANTLAVRVDNSLRPDIAPLEADFTFYGGIYRDVWLIETPDAHLGVLEPYQNSFWYTKQVVDSTKADVEITLPLLNQGKGKLSGTIELRVMNPIGAVVQTLVSKVSLGAGKEELRKLNVRIQKPQLWHPESPNLYTVEARLIDNGNKQILDLVQQPLGLRWYKFTANEGFFLNGKPLKLMGVCRHQDRANIGPELTDEMHEQDVKYIKEMGGNFVRIAHYPQDPAFLQACDRLGVVAWEEIPIVNKITVSDAFTNACMSQVRDMVNQHRNHPSIVIWGYMNEVLIRTPKKEEEDAYMAKVVVLAKKLDSLCRALDPARYTAMALHYNDRYERSGLINVAQITGWNLYHGWYHDTYQDFGAYMDKQHKEHPERIHIISEYGAGLDTRLSSDSANIYDFTSNWGQGYHEAYLKQIMDRPYIAGGAIWNLVDFGSEGRKETMPYINNKGMLTMDRRKKDVFYLYEAALHSGILTGKGFKPVVRIAETERPIRRVVFPRGFKHTKIRIKCYGNVPTAVIYVNNRNQGEVKFNNYVGYADVVVTPGVNKVYLLHEKNLDKAMAEDVFMLTVDDAPEFLQDGVRPFKEVALNCGSTAEYRDPLTHLTWLPEKPYTAGSYGYIGGSKYFNSKRLGSQDYIAGTEHQPLFQTRRDGVEAYQFDVPKGQYEVELLWAETNPKAKGLVNDIGNNNTATNTEAERVFSVWVNGLPVVQELDLVRDYGFSVAVTKKALVTVIEDKGIRVDLKAIKGTTTLSGIKVRRLQ